MDLHSASIAEILRSAKNIAVVGLSDDPSRPSHGVARYLQNQGYTIIPVNPNTATVLGQTSYPSLGSIPREIRVDIVDIFRRSEFVAEAVDEAIARKPRLIWMQQGVVDESSAKKAEDSGIPVVMDACLAVVHRQVLAAP